MFRYTSFLSTLFLIVLSVPLSGITQDFQIRDNNSNAISIGQGRIGLKQGRTRVQQGGNVPGLAGLNDLQRLQQLQQGTQRRQQHPPERCIRDVKTGTSFNMREYRYGSDVALSGNHTISTRTYSFSRSLIIEGHVENRGTGDFVINEHLIVHGSLLNQGTGDIHVAGDLFITGNLENSGTGNIEVNGTIYALNNARISNIGTGKINGASKIITSESDIRCN